MFRQILKTKHVSDGDISEMIEGEQSYFYIILTPDDVGWVAKQSRQILTLTDICSILPILYSIFRV